MKKEFNFIVLSYLIPLVSLVAQNDSTVTIGKQIWMKHNLNIPVDSGYCYKNEPKNCELFGGLYNWATATSICPGGFRLPTDDDWTILTESAGGMNHAGRNLQMGGETGFGILMAGNYNASLKIFSYQFRQAYFWTASSYSKTAAWMRNFSNEKTNVNRSTINKEYFFSVRCIKDE